MRTTTISSRDFNQDRDRTKQSALEGPVFMTDRGRPAHVPLSIEKSQRLILGKQNVADLLGMPGVEDVELGIVLAKDLPQSADLI